MSAFDPANFANTTFDQGVDTRYPLHNAGQWNGAIGAGEKDLSARTVTTKDGDRTVWEIWLYADDPKAQGEGFDPPARCRYTMWIDLAPSGGLDFSPGKNRQLGNLLTALGFQDKTGKLVKPWSPNSFKGMRLAYTVKHEPRKDNGELQASVDNVLALV